MNSLASYLKTYGIKQSDFATAVGLSQGTVSRLAAGTMTPSLEAAARIERETGGRVAMSSWVQDATDANRGAA